MQAILRIASPTAHKILANLNDDGALVRENFNRWDMVYEVEGQMVYLSDKASYSLPIA